MAELRLPLLLSFKSPLSGDVVQAINPWNWVFKTQAGQYGIVNINLGKSPDPELEHRILEEVGTYGRQIGRIGEVLEVLLRHVEVDALDATERAALDDFSLQMEQVKRLKRQQARW